MSTPTIHSGPAIITRGSYTYYSEGDITATLNRETFKIATSAFGEIDTRLKSQMVELSFTPVGALDVVAKYLPYALSNIGGFIFPASPVPAVVKGKDSGVNTWGASAITKLPSFRLSPIATAFSSEMTIAVLGNPAKDLTADDAWDTITTAAFADTSFDHTKIVTGNYTATTDLLDATIEPEEGFTFEVAIETKPHNVANYGVVNMTLTGITAVCRFVPANLTEAQMWTLMGLQGEDAILPGQSLSKTGEDLVITDGTRTFTLHNAGPQKGLTRYGLEPLRPGEVAFVSRKTWASGTINLGA